MSNIEVRKNIPARVIQFSPPDISELEIEEVAEALRSGWITTGPRTKELERRLAEYCHTSKTVCLNSATAAEELNFRICGIGEGDEVIAPAYTYTATAYQELGNKRYNALTQEMVDVSFEIFKNSGNANKNSFSMWFEGMWHRYKDMQDINIEILQKSLMDFKEKLSRLCDDYKKNDCPIALMHTIKFIEIIKEILLGNATEE